MKNGIHAHYRTGAFHDTRANSDTEVGYTIQTARETAQEGMVYPYVTVDVSSASHSFYTGKQNTCTSKGSVARFSQRFGRFFQQKDEG